MAVEYETVAYDEDGTPLLWSDHLNIAMLTRKGRILVRFSRCENIAVDAWTGVCDKASGYERLYDLPSDTPDATLISIALNLYRTGIATYHLNRPN